MNLIKFTILAAGAKYLGSGGGINFDLSLIPENVRPFVLASGIILMVAAFTYVLMTNWKGKRH